MTRALLHAAALAALVVVVVVDGACGAACRDVEATELREVECESPPRFTGEIHFDNLATFDTFLRQQCMFTADDEVIDAILEKVDFTSEGVFVAVGPAAIDNTRCVTRRDLDSAAVCSDGLKVSFDDDYASAAEGCPGTRWTVAFALAREDLRAALAAGDVAEAQ